MICKKCGMERVHYARELCRGCYRIEWAKEEKQCPDCGKTFKQKPYRTYTKCPQCYQKTYRKKYMKTYNQRPLARKRILAGYKKRRDEKYNIIRTLKSERGCIDCGIKDWRVLEFDHLGDKQHGIANMISTNLSLERIMSEVAKCEVRCANCHKIKTFERRSNI